MGNETSGGLLTSAVAALGRGQSSARIDAEVLLAHALDAPRTRLHGWPDEPVPARRAARFRELVARRAGGEPVAYLTGTREFWSLLLEVTPKTLIPRPETERLVEVALALIADGEAVTVADLGTGTGAVAAAIASERPACRVVATDVCAQALAVAARNTDRLGLDNVSLRRSDWLDTLAGERFALIVSNPPYVACDDPHLGSGDVRFEPPLALRAGDDGLDAIRRICASALAHLLPGAALALEHGHDQGPAVRELLHRHGYRNVRGYQDLAGNERVAVGFA
jgi:release factor glutamine methyltransferase